MNIINSIILGIVQGFTEFLPVSSSGHLVIIQSLIPNFSQPGVLFDVILHFGTLFSIIFYFRKKLPLYINPRYIGLLVVGTIPAVLFGFLFKDRIEGLFSSVRLVGFALILTGLFNLYIDRLKTNTSKISNKNALITGMFQALAIVPGVSRSGSTILASVAQKIDKKAAAEFSFILSVPAVLGANVLEFFSNRSVIAVNLPGLIFGFLAAFVSGILAIKLVFGVISKKKFEYFGYYCFIIAIIAIILG